MPSAIELHDSDLTAITHDGTSAVLLFSPAYLHRWDNRLGDDSSTGWLQVTTLTFAAASVSSTADLPCEIADGSLRIGDAQHDNLIPADGMYEAPCELRLTLANFAQVIVRGTRLAIVPHGEPSYVEKFTL